MSVIIIILLIYSYINVSYNLIYSTFVYRISLKILLLIIHLFHILHIIIHYFILDVETPLSG